MVHGMKRRGDMKPKDLGMNWPHALLVQEVTPRTPHSPLVRATDPSSQNLARG